QLATSGGDDVEQYLEALRRKLRRQLFEPVTADHEEAAHGIGDFDAEHALCNLGGKHAGAGALLVKAVGAAALNVTAANYQFRLPALREREHFWQLRLVMLQIGIDHGRIGRAGSQNAFDAGTGQAAPADATDAADAGIASRQVPHHFP